MNTKISIVIPVYNVAAELGSCLDSILAQTYQNLEIIIVNDGSEDATAVVMEAYAARDQRIRTVHKENGGVTSARLRGVQEATGDWVGFVDGDDQIDPHMYFRLLENAEKYGADISHCGYRKILPNRTDYYYNTGRIIAQNRETALRDLICAEFVEPALWNKLYRRSLFHKLLSERLIDTTIRNYEDMLMNFYLFREASKAIYEDFCPYLYIYRTGSASTAKPNKNKLLDPLQVLKIIRDSVSDAPLLRSHAEVRLFSYLVTLSTLPIKGHADLICPIRTDARKEMRSMLPNMRNNSACNKKQYLKGLWAAYLPTSYAYTQSLFRRLSGKA